MERIEEEGKNFCSGFSGHFERDYLFDDDDDDWIKLIGKSC